MQLLFSSSRCAVQLTFGTSAAPILRHFAQPDFGAYSIQKIELSAQLYDLRLINLNSFNVCICMHACMHKGMLSWIWRTQMHSSAAYQLKKHFKWTFKLRKSMHAFLFFLSFSRFMTQILHHLTRRCQRLWKVPKCILVLIKVLLDLLHQIQLEKNELFFVFIF